MATNAPGAFYHSQQRAQGKAEYWVQLTASLLAGGAGPNYQQQGPYVAKLSLPNDFHVYGINGSWTSQLFSFEWGEQAAQWFWSANGLVDAEAAFTTYTRTLFHDGGEIIIPPGATGIEAYFYERSNAANTINLLFFGYLTP